MYTYRCPDCGAVSEQFARVSDRDASIPACHGQMVRQMHAPMVYAQVGTHAISPIDGTMLTSRRQRAEYMKRNGLQEALPAAETIRNAKARKAENERLASQIPALPEHVIREVTRQAGMA